MNHVLLNWRKCKLCGADASGRELVSDGLETHPTLWVIRAGVVLLAVLQMVCVSRAAEPIDIGSRLELFVDSLLIDRMDGAEQRLHHPRPAGVALKLDRPWEGQLSGYFTVIRDGDLCKMYYRGRPLTGFGDNDPQAMEVTCYAESVDGRTFTKPDLGLYDVAGTRKNNAVLKAAGAVTHNFAPFLDTRPGVGPSERYKAVGGSSRTGLIAYVSADGLHWKKLREEPIIKDGAFDSQNNVFWSQHEQRYVCFYRTFRNKVRWISRATSPDFLNWDAGVDMSFGDAPNEHLYTNQTEPYFRAPHIYIGTAARFWPGRQALSDQQVAAIGLEGPENYAGLKSGSSDAVLLSSRGGDRFERTFLASWVRPGGDLQSWTARSNYPARGVVQTGPREMSVYVQRHYGQPTAYVERLALRIDGFASIHGPYQGGELTTKPLKFSGGELIVNFATSAAGSVRVEMQDEKGMPIPGLTLADSEELLGDEIERVVRWKSGSDVSRLAGQTVRLRFVLKDADLYSIRFGDS